MYENPAGGGRGHGLPPPPPMPTPMAVMRRNWANLVSELISERWYPIEFSMTN